MVLILTGIGHTVGDKAVVANVSSICDHLVQEGYTFLTKVNLYPNAMTLHGATWG